MKKCVSGVSLAWFQSYLTSRFQRTVIGQATSCNRRVSVGVPKGSILGPLLFSIYINDLPTCLKHPSVTLFADDTALYCSAKSSTDLQQIMAYNFIHHGPRASTHVPYSVLEFKRRSNFQQRNKWNFALP